MHAKRKLLSKDLINHGDRGCFSSGIQPHWLNQRPTNNIELVPVVMLAVEMCTGRETARSFTLPESKLSAAPGVSERGPRVAASASNRQTLFMQPAQPRFGLHDPIVPKQRQVQNA